MFIVDFIIPPAGPLQSLKALTFSTGSSDSDSVWITAGLGLLLRGRDSEPKNKNYVYGVTLTLGEAAFRNATLRFFHDDTFYEIELKDFANP